MALSWCKVASNLDSHPKIRRAGRNGREVFLFALRRNKEPGNPVPGRLPIDQLEPWYIADQLQMPEADAVTGVTAAVTAGLLVLEGLSYVIVGWDDDWGTGPVDGKDRTAKWREKHKPVTPVTSRDVTNVTQRHGDARDVREEKRGEETRGEEKADTSPPAPVLFDIGPRPPSLAELIAIAAIDAINAAAKTTFDPESTNTRKLCRALAKARHTPARAREVVEFKRTWLDSPKMRQHFTPGTLLALKNFEKYVDEMQGGALPPAIERPVGRGEPKPESAYEADESRAF